MANLTLPPGLLPDAIPKGLTDHRLTRFEYELQDADGASKGALDGIEVGGTLTWNNHGKIKGGGAIPMSDNSQDIDWLNDRIRVSAVINDITIGLGVWIPTAPVEVWVEGNRTWQVEVHDKLNVLEEDKIFQSFGLPAGTVATTAVRDIIVGAGEPESSISLTASTATLTNDMYWEAGTSKLSICNNILSAAGYFTLRTGPFGQFLVRPYQAPHLRAVRYEFIDGVNSIYSSEFTRTRDIFKVPNRVVAVAQGDGDTEGLAGTAVNTNPDSEFSYPSRGRWITALYTGIEATDQAAINTYAQSKLVDLTSITDSVEILYAPVELELLDAVRFRSLPADIDALHVIDQYTWTLDPTELASATIRRVMEYDV